MDSSNVGWLSYQHFVTCKHESFEYMTWNEWVNRVMLNKDPCHVGWLSYQHLCECLWIIWYDLKQVNRIMLDKDPSQDVKYNHNGNR